MYAARTRDQVTNTKFFSLNLTLISLLSEKLFLIQFSCLHATYLLKMKIIF